MKGGSELEGNGEGGLGGVGREVGVSTERKEIGSEGGGGGGMECRARS